MLGVKPEKLPDEHHSWIGPAPWVATEIPGPNAAAIIAKSRQFGTKADLPVMPVVAKRAFGSVLEDVDGNRFLDFSAGISVGLPGHSPPNVVAAIEKQIRSLVRVCGHDCYHEIVTRLLERLTAVVVDGGPYFPWLTSRVEDALTTAITCARRHTDRSTIVSLSEPIGQWGDVTVLRIGRSAGDSLSRGLQPARTAQDEACGSGPRSDMHSFTAALEREGLDPGDIAAIVVESFQSSGPCGILDAEFIRALRAYSTENRIKLVCDESFSGMGNTGEWFAFQHVGITPDMIVVGTGLAGGLPLAVALVSEELLPSLPPDPIFRSSSASPVCCAAALAVLDVVGSSLLENARKLGRHLNERLTDITQRRRVVSGVRGMGLLFVADIVNRKSGRRDGKRRNMVLRSCYERGLLLAPAGDASIWFSPPACINKAQLDVGLALFDEGVATLP